MRREDRKKERRRVEEKWRGGQVKGERGKRDGKRNYQERRGRYNEQMKKI